MAINIGQYRFTGSGCVQEICNQSTANTLHYEKISASGLESESSFEDLVIQPPSSFSRNIDYHLTLAIPQDANYTMTFNLKLIKTVENTSTEYQFLHQFEVSIGSGEGHNIHTVVLYEDSTGAAKAMIPLPYVKGSENEKDLIYTDGTKYYLGNGGTSYTQTAKYNDISMVATWKTETTDVLKEFDIAFRPVEDGFDRILIELVRSAEDWNIQRENDDGTIGYGRRIDSSKVKYSLSTVTNLVQSISLGTPLDKIGVWGHMGLTVIVNGEPIRIGPSGFYELDALTIRTLGVVAKDYKDNFTIDYVYDDQS